MPVEYFWDNNYDEVKKIIQLETNEVSLSSFLNTPFDPDNSGDLENATDSVTSIFNKVMHMSFRIKKKAIIILNTKSFLTMNAWKRKD